MAEERSILEDDGDGLTKETPATPEEALEEDVSVADTPSLTRDTGAGDLDNIVQDDTVSDFSSGTDVACRPSTIAVPDTNRSFKHPLDAADDPLISESEMRVTSRIFTVANIVSIIRLCLIPAFFVLLVDGHNYLATFIFALAAGTDFIDGYIARSTSTVSKLGQVLDPAVDRLLMVFGVLGIYLVGRVPLWIIAVVLLRDAVLIFGGLYFMTRYRVRPKVVFVGKVATTLLFIGFGGLLLNWPLLDGLGLVQAAWLPGFNAEAVSWGIWFIYAGMLLGVFTTVHYIASTLMKVGAVKAERAREMEAAAQAASEGE